MSKKRNAIIDKLKDTPNDVKSAGDINEIWNLANEGRIRTFIAEENYTQSCKQNGDSSITPVDHAEKGMIDDAVDEIAEIVINKGGKVVFVDDGLLNGYNRIAAILRY